MASAHALAKRTIGMCWPERGRQPYQKDFLHIWEADFLHSGKYLFRQNFFSSGIQESRILYALPMPSGTFLIHERVIPIDYSHYRSFVSVYSNDFIGDC